MKKKLSVLFFIIIFPFFAFSFSKNLFDFSIATGVLNGEINEYVFYSSDPQCDDKESQLDWDIKNIPFAEADLKLTLDNVFFDISGRIGLPKNTGVMQDYDWLNGLDLTELTNYSIHTNYLNNYYSFTASLGLNFYPLKELKLSPFCNIKYENIFFEGLNGYRTYKSEDWVPVEFTGKVISYQQVMKAISFGITFYSALSNFDINLSASVSPKLCYINACDFHWRNRSSKGVIIGGTLFNDRLFSAIKYNGLLEVFYKINPTNHLGIKTSIEYINTTKGNTFSKKLDLNGEIISINWSSMGGLGGSSRLLYDLSFIYKILF